MNFDLVRLAVVYYPLTFLFTALVAGYFLRDLIEASRALVRFLRRRSSKNIGGAHVTPDMRDSDAAVCLQCDSGWEGLFEGDACPICGMPLQSFPRGFSTGSL